MLQISNQQQQHTNNFVAMEAETIKNAARPKSQMSRRNKRSLIIFVCLLFFAAFSTYAQETKLRVAVLDLYSITKDNSYCNYEANAKTLTSALTNELVNTNKFRVVERSRIEDIMKELGLQSDQDASVRAAEIGKLLGVHKIITGEYRGNYDRWHFDYATIYLRLIDVESGDIEKAVTIEAWEKRPYYKNDKDRAKGKVSSYYHYEFSKQEIVQKLLAELFK